MSKPSNSKSSPAEQKLLKYYSDVEEGADSERRRKRIQAVKKLLKEILRYRALLWGGVAVTLVSTLATLMEPRLIGAAIDRGLVPKDWSQLRTIALLLLGVELIRVVALISNNYLFSLLGQKVMQDLRQLVFSHLQRMHLTHYDQMPVGRLVTRVTNDTSALSDMFSAGLITMLGNVLVVLGTAIGLLILDWRLGLIGIAIFPFLLYVTVHFSNRLAITYRDARSKLSALNAFLAENILGMKVVQLFNREQKHLERFSTLAEWYAQAQFASVKVFSVLRPTITISMGISVALILYFGGGMVLRQAIPLGVFVAAIAYANSIFEPIRDITDKWNVFLAGLASAERIYGVLDWKPEAGNYHVHAELKEGLKLRGEIEFQNVWFAYRSGESEPEWVLKDFSIKIEPGTRVGIVGPTGSGKTTITSLLLGFYEPQKGRILIDGKDIRDYDKRELRSAIATIQQEPFLFSGSISDNITFWREDPKLLEWLKSNQVLQPLSDVPLDRPLEERGNNLSIGQKQMMSFARALYKDPSIWIMDEATANMDSESEKDLETLLSASAKGKSLLMIAHRLSTVREAGLIMVLHKGVLIEKGRHEDLMRVNGLYARMFRYQSSEARAAEAQV